MKALTIKDLYEECKKQMAKGNGNKVIMISNDDEGNGYHYLWYTFSEDTEEFLENDYLGMRSMINESVAKIEDTIILG